MTNFIVKEKLISGKCVERVTIPKKVIYQGVLSFGRVQLDLWYKELTSFSNIFFVYVNLKQKHFLQSMLAISKLEEIISTGCIISFHTLEMSCLWWTGFEEIPNEEKYNPHIIWKF